MGNISPVITALTVAAGLSMVVERLLEIVKHFREEENAKIDRELISNKVDSSVSAAKKEVARIKSAFENLKDMNEPVSLMELKPEDKKAETENPSNETPGDDDDDTDGLFFERHSNVTLILSTLKKAGEAQSMLVLALLGAGLGIILAELFNVKLVSLFLGRNVSHWKDILLSGIVIGGGSQPIHVLIRFLTTRKLPATEEEKGSAVSEEERVEKAPAPKLLSAAAQAIDAEWRHIEYRGGVKPETLEHRNLQPGPPDLIVYHHTAMSSNVPFQGIVDEFLTKKKWSTGYHCVIMPNGDIKPFCRWDRRGNHAKGRNSRSLGVSFHGNFHGLANDEYSNHDGRYGNRVPTPAQLDAGARLISLWASLYDSISPDFGEGILPHRDVILGHTVCPGSEFPHGALQRKVDEYLTAWNISDIAKQQIATLKQKPYLYDPRWA